LSIQLHLDDLVLFNPLLGNAIVARTLAEVRKDTKPADGQHRHWALQEMIELQRDGVTDPARAIESLHSILIRNGMLPAKILQRVLQRFGYRFRSRYSIDGCRVPKLIELLVVFFQQQPLSGKTARAIRMVCKRIPQLDSYEKIIALTMALTKECAIKRGALDSFLEQSGVTFFVGQVAITAIAMRKIDAMSISCN